MQGLRLGDLSVPIVAEIDGRVPHRADYEVSVRGEGGGGRDGTVRKKFVESSASLPKYDAI